MPSEDQEVIVRLNRIARMIGRVFSIDVGVDTSGDRLIFVTADGEPITNDGDELVAATGEEIAGKDIGDFAARALRAGMLAKYQEIERSRTP